MVSFHPPSEETFGANGATLPPRVQEILSTIDDGDLRRDVHGVVFLALAAFNNLSRLHLPQDSFEEGAERPADDDKYLELAPYVLAAVASVNRTLSLIAQTFPPDPSQLAQQNKSDEDFDLEFDLADGASSNKPVNEEPAAPPKSARLQVVDAVHAYGGMLRSRVLVFAQRLRYAVAQPTNWPLLAELDDYKHKLQKAVQGLLFGVLGIFAKNIKREEIVPAYRSAVSESVSLRTAVSELSHHINRFNTALGSAAADTVVPLVVAVADKLARFCSRPEYRALRAEDKKAVIDFRKQLYELRQQRQGSPLGALKFAVEGFSKFLESLAAINHREVLVLHDAQKIEEALARLENVARISEKEPATAFDELRRIVDALGVVTGRNPDLDDARRDFLAEPDSQDEVGTALVRWHNLLEGVLASVG